MRKGQIVTLDVLAALVALTALVGVSASSFSAVFEKKADLEYEKLHAIASDWANIGVSNLSLKDDNSVFYSNIVKFDSSFQPKFDGFTSTFQKALFSPYAAEIAFSTYSKQLNGGCSGKQSQAIGRRLLADIDSRNVLWLTVKVCA